jgi:hypothetical protein
MNEMDLLAHMRDNAPRRVSPRVEHTFRAALYENQYPERARLAPRQGMKNDLIDGRLRDAPATHAETIPTSPDARQRIQAKDARLSRQQRGFSCPLGVGWLARRSVRRRAVLSAGVAVAAAAVAAVTLTAGSAPPALATATTALTRTLTQSYHLTEQDSSYNIVNGQIRGFLHNTCVREVDPVRHLQASSCSPLFPSDYREVGGYLYLYQAWPVTGHPGVHWIRTPASFTVGPVFSFWPTDSLPPVTPLQMLSAIKKADKVTVAGPASGPGWTGTRYAFSGSPSPRTTISGTLAVDGQGRARALVLTTRQTGLMPYVTTRILTFSEFGARVTVTPPPADQTIPQGLIKPVAPPFKPVAPPRRDAAQVP